MAIVSAIKSGESPQAISIDDPRLFNMNDLAVVLGVKRAFIRKMKSEGFRMPFGRATVAMAHEFIRQRGSDDED
jgi:hypothetical protein